MASLRIGDVSDVYRAVDDQGEKRIIKLSRPSIPDGAAMLRREAETINTLQKSAEGTAYGRYFPVVIDSATTTKPNSQTATVFKNRDDYFTLSEIHQKFPSGLDGRHVSWIFNRLLTVIGFSHSQGILHRGILPDNILVKPANHSVKLIDWKEAGTGALSTISGRWRTHYPPETFKKERMSPASDIYMAAKAVMWVGGPLPPQITAHLRACTMESMLTRPQDAWVYLEEFKHMLEDVYGPPRFVHLSMT